MQHLFCLQHNLECIPKTMNQDKCKYTSITLQESTNSYTEKFFVQYRLCKHFCFLKSSIIFFTKSKVIVSPSILAPEYCGSTSIIKIKNQNIFMSMSEIKCYKGTQNRQKMVQTIKDHWQHKINRYVYWSQKSLILKKG